MPCRPPPAKLASGVFAVTHRVRLQSDAVAVQCSRRVQEGVVTKPCRVGMNGQIETRWENLGLRQFDICAIQNKNIFLVSLSLLKLKNAPICLNSSPIIPFQKGIFWVLVAGAITQRMLI